MHALVAAPSCSLVPSFSPEMQLAGSSFGTCRLASTQVSCESVLNEVSLQAGYLSSKIM